MSRFQPRSFAIGILAGVLILVLFRGGVSLTRIITSSSSKTASSQQRFRSGGPGLNIGAMAEQLGMTRSALEEELKTGKSLRDIATERGIDFATLRGGRTGSGSLRGGSGAFLRSGSGEFLRGGTGSFMRRSGSGASMKGNRPVNDIPSTPKQ
ncbi:MAG: hypothetical protein PHZ00_01005 [Candidatus Peribacteraceae bacterium]|nr:hypothetical protein [Candidatus Peribacteraceae bacterium]